MYDPPHTPAARWPPPVALLLAIGMALVGTGCAHQRPMRVAQPIPPAIDFQVRRDHEHFYSQRTLLLAAEGFAVGAILAHTDADQEIRDWWQDDVRTGRTDGVANVVTHFGDGALLLPALGTALLAGELWDDSPRISGMGDWADQSLRGILVGVPPLIVTQLATGASRPGESSSGSSWVPFHDNNGVSGHSFMGAVPFITAAQMTDDPVEKAGWYVASTLTGWSRINDDAHYTSQVILGWWLAYLACSSVSQTEQEMQDVRFVPVPLSDGVGVGILWER